MAATSVLSLVLLLMVGMQDQMSRAWTNANRRTEATREARAGLRMLTEDFIHYYIRDVLTNAGPARANYNPSTSPIAMVYFSNAAATNGGLSILGARTNSQALFFLSQRRPGTNSPTPDQLTAVGYYIASDPRGSTNINGMISYNYHLYRYVNTNILPAFPNPTPARLFTNVGPTFPSNNEVLTCNAVDLRIYFYPATSVPTTGLIYRLDEASSSPTNIYSGNRCVFELVCYPETVANTILQAGSNMSAWTNSGNLKRYARTFETSMDLERSLAK